MTSKKNALCGNDVRPCVRVWLSISNLKAFPIFMKFCVNFKEKRSGKFHENRRNDYYRLFSSLRDFSTCNLQISWSMSVKFGTDDLHMSRWAIVSFVKIGILKSRTWFKGHKWNFPRIFNIFFPRQICKPLYWAVCKLVKIDVVRITLYERAEETLYQYFPHFGGPG